MKCILVLVALVFAAKTALTFGQERPTTEYSYDQGGDFEAVNWTTAMDGGCEDGFYSLTSEEQATLSILQGWKTELERYLNSYELFRWHPSVYAMESKTGVQTIDLSLLPTAYKMSTSFTYFFNLKAGDTFSCNLNPSHSWFNDDGVSICSRLVGPDEDSHYEKNQYCDTVVTAAQAVDTIHLNILYKVSKTINVRCEVNSQHTPKQERRLWDAFWISDLLDMRLELGDLNHFFHSFTKTLAVEQQLDLKAVSLCDEQHFVGVQNSEKWTDLLRWNKVLLKLHDQYDNNEVFVRAIHRALPSDDIVVAQQKISKVANALKGGKSKDKT